MGYALITGASSGIGYEFAKLFAQDGHDLVLVARRQERLESLKEELEELCKIKVLVIIKDLSKAHAAQEVYEEIKNQSINIDFLINNAGFGERGDFAETDWDKEYRMLQLNMVALTELTKCFIPEALKTNNPLRVLNVASTAAFQPGPYMAVYFATKAYVLSFSEAIASELKNTNITVTTLCPGPTQSEFFEAANMVSSITTSMPAPTSEACAKYGYQKMMQGKRVVIHGLKNKLLIMLSGILPRNAVLWITKKFLAA